MKDELAEYQFMYALASCISTLQSNRRMEDKSDEIV